MMLSATDSEMSSTLRLNRTALAARAAKTTNGMVDWNDPAACLALIERVGIAEYNRLHAEHCLQLQAVAKTVNGHAIRKTTFFTVADRSFYTLDQATNYARKLRRRRPGI
jgi:hypothetical protein